jgi:hypothetical protein
VQQELGGADILVNNAGVMLTAPSRRGVRPRLVVEQLTLRPNRERRDEHQDRGQPEQAPDKHAALFAHLLLRSSLLG